MKSLFTIGLLLFFIATSCVVYAQDEDGTMQTTSDNGVLISTMHSIEATPKMIDEQGGIVSLVGSGEGFKFPSYEDLHIVLVKNLPKDNLVKNLAHAQIPTVLVSSDTEIHLKVAANSGRWNLVLFTINTEKTEEPKPNPPIEEGESENAGESDIEKRSTTSDSASPNTATYEVFYTLEIRFNEPTVVPSRLVYPPWTQFLPIRGEHFNPDNVRVVLTQTKPSGHVKRATQAPTTTQHECVIVHVHHAEITCAVMDLQAGPVSAVVYSNGVATMDGRPQVVAVISADKDGAWTTYSSYSNGQCVPPNGVPDPFTTNLCNCFSGYAPSTAEGTDCNVRAKCAERYLNAEDEIAGDNSPQRPITSFHDDKLRIVQHVPIVLARRGFWIGFEAPKIENSLPLTPAGTEGAETCNYPGILWNKTVTQLDCLDIYTAEMPWVQNMYCGFVQDLAESTVEWAVYKTVMVSEFVEVYKMEGKMFQRLSRFSYLVEVKFMTQKKFTSDALSVYIADSQVTGFVNVKLTSDAVYDVASGMVLVQFLTTSAWPYMLKTDADAPKYAATSANNAKTPGLDIQLTDVDYAANVACDFTQDSSCTQAWYARIDTNEACDIEGTYTFAGEMECRDVNNPKENSEAIECPAQYQNVEFAFHIKKTDLCAPDALDATANLKITLTPFFDEDLTNQEDTYQTGDMIYWRVDVSNDQSTIDRVAFHTILLSLDGAMGATAEDVIFDESLLTSKGTDAELKITPLDDVTLAGSTGHLRFSHRLYRAALTQTVGLLDSNTGNVVLRTSITLDLWYHGNQKRSVSLQVDPSASVSHSYNIQIVDNGDKQSVDAAPVADDLLDADAEAGAAPRTVAALFAMFLVVIAFVF